MKLSTRARKSIFLMRNSLKEDKLKQTKYEGKFENIYKENILESKRAEIETNIKIEEKEDKINEKNNEEKDNENNNINNNEENQLKEEQKEGIKIWILLLMMIEMESGKPSEQKKILKN